MTSSNPPDLHQPPYNHLRSDKSLADEVNPWLADLISHHVRLLIPEMQVVIESSIKRTLHHPTVRFAQQNACPRCQTCTTTQPERPGSAAECRTSHPGASLSAAKDMKSNIPVNCSPAETEIKNMLQPLCDSLSRVENQLAALNERGRPFERLDVRAVSPVKEPSPSSNTNKVAKIETSHQHSHAQDQVLKCDTASGQQVSLPDQVPPVFATKLSNIDPDDEVEASALQVVFSYLPQNEITDRLMAFCEWISGVQEPPRHGILAKIVHNSKFEVMCVSVILTNAAFAAYQADWEMSNINAPEGGSMQLLSAFFCCFYVMELALKLAVHRGYFFINGDWKWNVFDTLLVLLALYDQLTTLFLRPAGANLSFMRTFRLMKLTRVVRLFRVLKFFRELRMLMIAIGRSFIQLLWSGIMLLFILYVFGLVLLQGVSGYLSDPGHTIDATQKEDFIHFFGSTGTSIMSLYMASTGGLDWGDVYAIVKPTGLFFQCAFIFYTAFFTFAVFNILTGMFVDNMITIGDGDDAYMVLQFRRAQKKRIKELQTLFDQFDTDCSGTLTAPELEAAMRSERGKAVLETLGLDVKDATTFFTMLVSIAGSNDIDAESFIEGCLRMKGAASGVDLACLAFQTKLMYASIVGIKADVAEVLENSHRENHTQRGELKRSYSGDHWAFVDWQGKTTRIGCSL